ncbi:AzlD domain-containing protein [Bradyrhizobium manausense]
MLDWPTLSMIVGLGTVSYAMRAGGFLAAGLIREQGITAKFFRLAPGNLFVAFVASACSEGGLPSIVGCAGAFGVMVLIRKEWAALAAGFVMAATVAALRPQ